VEVKVGDGDILVIASDGVLEARDNWGRIFGPKGITAAVYKNRYQSPEVIADEILRAVKRHTGKERPDDDQTLMVVQIGQPVKGSHLVTVKTLEMKNGVFSLLNAGDTGAACHYELREKLKGWAQNRGFEERRIRQIWAATWEAIQNAVKYGSRRGNAIYIRLIFIGYEGLVKVEVTQPLLWEDWDKVLGQRMKNEVQTDKVLMGGTIIMLWLANEIQVTDRGRRITMAFSKNVVPERKVKVFF
jgi:anti-sigma regulatory factor (Ser/Thr protein kinase)